jgi:hypothetical protein
LALEHAKLMQKTALNRGGVTRSEQTGQQKFL